MTRKQRGVKEKLRKPQHFSGPRKGRHSKKDKAPSKAQRDWNY